MTVKEKPALLPLQLCTESLHQTDMQLLSSLTRTVFEHAYSIGRQDTLEGYYIDPSLAYEDFTARQLEQLKQQQSTTATPPDNEPPR